MDPRLLRFYNAELSYLRESAREFGEEHEAVAGRLGLKTPTDPDPYVERLLEGVAFLSARVQLKLEDQFPDFTQHLLQAIQPHYLAPMPSICVAGFEPREGDPVLLKGHAVKRGTKLTANAAEHDDAQVVFTTAHEVTLWPLKLKDAEYLASRASIARYAAAAKVRAEAGLRIRIAANDGVELSKVLCDSLPIYFAGSEAVPNELYRQCIGDAVAVIAQPADSASDAWDILPLPGQVGFEDDQALLPADRRSFRGYRLLSEYFACPERFLFGELKGLRNSFARAKQELEIVILFGRQSALLAGAIGPNHLKLFATPAINLFERQLDRVQVRPTEHEFLVIPDRRRRLDYEVFRILDVQAFVRENVEPRPVAPLYAYGALLYDWREALFYATRLVPRRLSTLEQRRRRRTEYIGTETWVSLTAPGDPSRLEEVGELAVRALVTNRELPELLTFRGTDHFAVGGVPARTVSVLRAPSRPRPPLGLGEAAWRVIGHLTPNYTTLAPEDHDSPEILRDHLALYIQADDAALRKQVDGVLAISSRKVTRRVPGLDRLAVARGHRITLKLDDGAFDNSRIFLFSAVLERFLAEFATVNSFTETIVDSAAEGRIMQWPPRVGRRHNI